MKDIKCFIFDLDGTLVFNEKGNFLAYQAAFKSEGLDFSEADFTHHYKSGGHINDIYAEYAEKHGVLADKTQLGRIKATKSAEYPKYFSTIEQNHAMIGLLRSLSRHYHTALVTTAKKQNGRNVLEHFGLAELFDYTIFREDVSSPKPDPECHRKVAAHFGVEPDECMVFEDSPKGLAAAEAFGAHICKVVR